MGRLSVVERFRRRRARRLDARGIRLDAGWSEQDHPRDENGRFTSGGGGGSKRSNEPKLKRNEPEPKGGGSSEKAPKASGKFYSKNGGKEKTVAGYRRKNSFVNGYHATDTSEREDRFGKTIKENTNENGEWTSEREAVHSKIIDNAFSGVKKAKGKPVTTFMGGGPASGKSYVRKNLGDAIGLPKPDEAVKIDPDECKAQLPEYTNENPGLVHAESSAVAKRIWQLARENGYNTLYDGTGDGSVAGMEKKIRQARESGNVVNAVYIYTPVENAIEQSKNRDRKLDEDLVVDIHRKVSEIVPQIAKDFDDIKIVYNKKGETPKVIAEGGNGKPLRAIDKKLYQDFLDVKNYKHK